MRKRFAFTGPESSGKTTLSIALADNFNARWIPEFARDYLEQLSGTYSQYDLDLIARGQLELLQKAENEAIVLCDTEMLVLKIWSEFKYGNCSPLIENAFKEQEFDHYFLCRPDIPWEDDPLREHPEQREQLFDLYHKYLIEYNLPFTIVEGDLANRLSICARVIEKNHF
jgi:NadR type nicotinamide-nucleotide adenylyltransferase